ncbi:MAG: glycosyltransferase family 39 protein [Bacteroidia bacterium]|jgi:4-amino-4-deoxy-L-arabinose transferase-like glycosyltransferase|nr:glycosyltransferase family 39 protein [Bacteroidia bacterium]
MRNLPVIPLLIIALSLVLVVPSLGHSQLFDWDEINFAECAREMMVTGDYTKVQINFLPFWEKPPLFIWMQVLSMKAFGVNEFAARLPNAIGGIITLLVLWNIGRRHFDKRFAALWVLVYAGSLLPQFYFHSGIIDPWFNLFIFLSIYQFLEYTSRFTEAAQLKFWNRNIILSALFMGLAVLTKGPVALLVFGLCFVVYRIVNRRRIMSWLHFGLYAGITALVAGSWFAMLAVRGGGHLVLEFILYQIRLFSTEDAGHGGNFFYHWIVLLVGCFPAAGFAVQAMFKRAADTPYERHQLRWMRIMFWVVLLLFSVVKTKIVHYSSLCYFPLTWLATYSIYKLMAGQFTLRRWVLALVAVPGILLGVALAVLPFIDRFKASLLESGSVRDEFAAANLQADGGWLGVEFLAGVLLLVCLLVALWIMRRRMETAVKLLFGSTLLVTAAAAALIAPRVEKYSQDAAVQFWKSKAGQNVYVETYGYKSFAPYFYAQTRPVVKNNPRYTAWRKNVTTPLPAGKSRSEFETELQREWMLKGDIDRPAFFVCKNTREKELISYYPWLIKLYSQNGFVFWMRDPAVPVN